MSEMAEFLLARIAEDVDRVGWWERIDAQLGLSDYRAFHARKRRVAECDAKRAIVEDFQWLHADCQVTHDPATAARRLQAAISMGRLAAVYADHPDYDKTWEP